MAGAASAMPELLNGYAARATRDCGELATWVRGPLAQQITSFEVGAVDYGQGVFSADQQIDVLVSNLLTRIWETDTEVSRVATLIATAAREGNLSPTQDALKRFGFTAPDDWFPPKADLFLGDLPNLAGRLPNSALVTTDEDIDNAYRSVGAHYALRYDGGPISAEVLAYADDPRAVIGFIDALTPQQLRALLSYPAGIDLLTRALASGPGPIAPTVSPATLKNLSDILLDPDFDRALAVKVLDGIAADPAAAAGFVRYLRLDEGLLRRFLDGDGWKIDDYPSSAPVSETGAFSGAFLRLLTATAPAMSAADVEYFVEFLTSNLPTSPDFKIVQRIEPDLTKLLLAMAPQLLEKAPSNADPEAIKDWSDKFAKDLKKLLLKDWLDKLYDVHLADEKDRNIFIQNMFLGMVGGAIGLGLPGGAVKDVIWGGVWGGGAGKWLQPMLDGLIDYPDPFASQRQLRIAALLAMLASLTGSDALREDGRPPIDFGDLIRQPGFEQALKSFVAGTWGDDYDSQDWAAKFKTSGINLEFLMDSLDTRLPKPPPTE